MPFHKSASNGVASVTVKALKMLTQANAVLRVDHSDDQSHCMARGEIGITAHQQSIVRIPA
jgi:hypothetical protein